MYNDLRHHGIKGQKWGVRRFQNKDGSLTPAGEKRYYVESDKKEKTNKDGSTTIPKGYQFNRVGQANLDVNRSGALYVSSGKADAARYVKNLGPTLIGKLLGTAGTTVQHITVKSELKKSSVEETCRSSAELLLNNKKLRKEIDESIYSGVIENGITEGYLKKAIANPKGKEAVKVGYAVSAILGDENYKKEAKTIYQYFRDKGYDALPDLNDTMTGTSETATIIINPSKVEMTSKTTITKDVFKDGKKYVKSLEKLPVNDLLYSYEP